jgi:hypothetical protein
MSDTGATNFWTQEELEEMDQVRRRRELQMRRRRELLEEERRSNSQAGDPRSRTHNGKLDFLA